MFAHPHPTHFNDSYASGVLGPGFIVALLLLLLRRGWGFVSPAALHVRLLLLLLLLLFLREREPPPPKRGKSGMWRGGAEGDPIPIPNPWKA